jgi:cysteinyl-tRNA synthetase
MSWKHLGETFDIHGGGIDLVFPHHENEIAQSRCAFHTDVMANVWMHNGFLQVEGEKMSKSVGNFFTIRELLEKWPGDVLRLLMLMTHYRQPIDWTEAGLHMASNELEDWAFTVQGYYHLPSAKLPAPDAAVEALSDDLNFPNAITVLRRLYARAKAGKMAEILEFTSNCQFLGFRQLGKPGYFRSGAAALNVRDRNISRYVEVIQKLRAAYANDFSELIKESLKSIIRKDGLDLQSEKDGRFVLVEGDQSAVKERIERLIDARTAARKAKDFKESDRIRDELAAMGVVLKDSKEGTTWEIAR